VELRIGRLRPRRSFHKECWDRSDPKQRIAWQDRAWRTAYRSSGTMVPGSSLSGEERAARDRRLAGTATEDDYRLFNEWVERQRDDGDRRDAYLGQRSRVTPERTAPRSRLGLPVTRTGRQA
jgi:hypothetical protein